MYSCLFFVLFIYQFKPRPVEFSPLRTRFEASETSVVDYYMYVGLVLRGSVNVITTT